MNNETYLKTKKPKNWKGLCKKHWQEKKAGNIIITMYFSDYHCWACGKKLNFKESYHKK